MLHEFNGYSQAATGIGKGLDAPSTEGGVLDFITYLKAVDDPRRRPTGRLRLRIAHDGDVSHTVDGKDPVLLAKVTESNHAYVAATGPVVIMLDEVPLARLRFSIRLFAFRVAIAKSDSALRFDRSLQQFYRSQQFPAGRLRGLLFFGFLRLDLRRCLAVRVHASQEVSISTARSAVVTGDLPRAITLTTAKQSLRFAALLALNVVLRRVLE